MNKFRKKPVVIEAQQWFPPGDERHDPAMLSHRPPDYRQDGDIFCFAEGASPGYGGDIFFVRTGGPNSDVQIHPGDWIITGVKGEKYPCKPDIFEATYEPV